MNKETLVVVISIVVMAITTVFIALMVFVYLNIIVGFLMNIEDLLTKVVG